MEEMHSIYVPLLAWALFVSLILLFIVLYRWARKQKGIALGVGLLIQMFLPDPKVQQTIEFVAESKKGSKESESEESGSANPPE